MSPSGLTSEQQARQTIDANLRAAGWLDGRAVGVLEAKKAGEPLRAHKRQTERYSEGLPATLTAPVKPLPFLYLSNGTETLFASLLDPGTRTREVFAVHDPETVAEWLATDSLHRWAQTTGAHTTADDSKPSTLRARLRAMPDLHRGSLYPNQIRAITNFERSFRDNRPRALVQMATGSGKTITAVSSIYRLIKSGGARRVLFLVDRTNLGEQAEKEFHGFRSPDDNRKFTELYNVQRLTTQTIGASTKVAEDKLSVVEAVAAPISANETRIARLRQAVLKWAFEGRLEDDAPTCQSHRQQEQCSASSMVSEPNPTP